jgi:hypothetical protein
LTLFLLLLLVLLDLLLLLIHLLLHGAAANGCKRFFDVAALEDLS